MKPIQNWQKGRIKMLQKDLNMDDVTYRSMLYGYGVKSCTKMTFGDAYNLIKKLEGMKTPNTPSPQPSPQPSPGGRGGKSGVETPAPQSFKKYDDLSVWDRMGLASAAQLRMLEGMWAEVSRVKDGPKARNEALDAFCKKHVGVGLLELDGVGVRKMVKTIQKMKK